MPHKLVSTFEWSYLVKYGKTLKNELIYTHLAWLLPHAFYSIKISWIVFNSLFYFCIYFLKSVHLIWTCLHCNLVFLQSLLNNLYHASLSFSNESSIAQTLPQSGWLGSDKALGRRNVLVKHALGHFCSLYDRPGLFQISF